MSGLEWFKVYGDIAENRKTIELEAEVGESALAYVIRAFCWISRHAADGDLSRIKPVVFERAVRWTGHPGKLWTALEACGFIEGTRWHDWAQTQEEHARQAHKKAGAVERKRRQREKDAESRLGHADVTRDMSVTPSLSLSGSSYSEEGAGGEVRHAVDARRPETPRAQTIVGLAESATAPKIPADVLKDHHYGPILRKKFPALDGEGPRPTLAGEVTALWTDFEKNYRLKGRDAAFNKLIGWIGSRYGPHEISWKRSGGVDVEAIANGKRGAS